MPGSPVKTPAGGFSSEVELGAPVERWLKRQGYSVVGHEVDAGVGVPDLVAGLSGSGDLRRRRRQAAPIVDPLQLLLLDFCSSSRTEDELRSWAPNGYSALVKRALTPLVERRLIVAYKGAVKASKKIQDPFTRLVAVELKLADTTRGIRQAHSYRVFADLSYLAMPSERLNLRAVAAAQDAGIGILAVTDDDVTEVVAPDRASMATPGRRRVASERTLAASANKTQLPAGSPRGRALVGSR